METRTVLNDTTLLEQATALAPYMVQVFRQMSMVKDVATIDKWGQAGSLDYTKIYSMPCLYYDAASKKRLHIQVLMSSIVEALKDGAKEEVIKAEQAAKAAQTAAEASASSAAESASAALAQKNETVGYLNTVKANEATRQQQEQARQSNESARASAESARVQAETARANAETTRRNQEANRVSAEQARESAETSRVNAENARANAETAREQDFAFVKTKAEIATADANAAAANANEKAALADTAATNANEKASLADTAATNANNNAALAYNAATTANTAAQDSNRQTALCKSATDLATELNDHPQKQGENGNWWKWNPTTNEYEDTGIIARGGGMYPMVRSRRNHVIWYDSTDGFKERIVRRRNHTVIKL